MSFRKEEEMYSFIEKWLEEGKYKCHATKREYPFKFLGSQRYVDVMGVYEEGSMTHFVGIEAKNSLESDDIEECIKQGQRLQSFCTDAYIALPRNDFYEESYERMNSIKSHISRAGLGLLLVKARGHPEVTEDPGPRRFNLSLYFQAESDFSESSIDEGPLSDDECDSLLNDFLKHPGLDSYEWKSNVWESKTTDEGGILTSDSGEIEIGEEGIEFRVYCYYFNDIVDRLLSVPNKIAEEMWNHLSRLRSRTKWIKRGLESAPRLVLEISNELEDREIWEGPWGNETGNTISIDSALLTDEDLVFELGTYLRKFDGPNVWIEATLSREILALEWVTSTRHCSEDMRDMYDIVLSITRTLRGSNDNES
ncbi:MAG: hypothetical protein ACFFER_05635 [Candidatus Thorarchaeota archaeon]